LPQSEACRRQAQGSVETIGEAAWRRFGCTAGGLAAHRPFRFQSVIGLVLVAIGGVIFSPQRHGHILFLAPDNIANIVPPYPRPRPAT